MGSENMQDFIIRAILLLLFSYILCAFMCQLSIFFPYLVSQD